MSKIVPLISSGTAGPLGVLHLPRLWQKVSLEAAGKIADGTYDKTSLILSLNISFLRMAIIENLVKKVISPQ